MSEAPGARERALELKKKMLANRNTKQWKELQEHYEGKFKQVRTRSSALERLTKQMEFLSPSVGEDSAAPFGQALPDAVDHTRKLLLADLDGVKELATENSFKILLNGLVGLEKRLQDTAEKRWAEHKQDNYPSPSNALLKLFEGFGGEYKKVVDGIRRLDEFLGSRAQEPPATKEELMVIDEIAERLGEEIKKLPLDGLPDAVQNFIREAQQPTGAPRSLWTQEVEDWFVQNQLGARVKMKIV